MFKKILYVTIGGTIILAILGLFEGWMFWALVIGAVVWHFQEKKDRRDSIEQLSRQIDVLKGAEQYSRPVNVMTITPIRKISVRSTLSDVTLPQAQRQKHIEKWADALEYKHRHLSKISTDMDRRHQDFQRSMQQKRKQLEYSLEEGRRFLRQNGIIITPADRSEAARITRLSGKIEFPKELTRKAVQNWNNSLAMTGARIGAGISRTGYSSAGLAVGGIALAITGIVALAQHSKKLRQLEVLTGEINSFEAELISANRILEESYEQCQQIARLMKEVYDDLTRVSSLHFNMARLRVAQAEHILKMEGLP